jgi:hypothetical protein
MNATSGSFYDTNGDGRINWGDRMVLKDTAAVEAGQKVQFLVGESVIGTIRELPA